VELTYLSLLRNDAVEKAKAGDRCILTGTLMVVPDVSALKLPGKTVRAFRDLSSEGAKSGIQGLKQTGVRELTYKLVFLGSTVSPADSTFGTVNIREETEEDVVR
jgi:DNA replication licensing factor MCM6